MSNAHFPAVSLHQFEASSSNITVDSDKGVIHGVSLITAGVIASGHTHKVPGPAGQPEKDVVYDLEVDEKTLTQMLACAEKMGKVPVKWNHRTGADAVSGYLKDFRIEGNKLLGDWHLLNAHPGRNHALELAEKMPECLGLSTSFQGKDEVKGLRAFARCTKLVSADLVASPAANPDGFFEEKIAVVDSAAESMAKQQTADGAAHVEAKEFSLADVMAGITQLQSGINDLSARTSQLEEFQDAVMNDTQEFEAAQVAAQAEAEANIEFASGDEALHYLAEKLSNIEDAKEQAKVSRAFAAYDAKVEKLLEFNEQLIAENSVMAEAIQEFSSKTGAVVQFSPGSDGGYEHHLSVPEVGRGATTDFERRCAQLEASGKSPTDAIRFAMKESPGNYQCYLQDIGTRARNL